jgi:UDP-N-acetylglucosamine--N-acetylmuramyl-(pentapeptide) pyrophosphoryl-undecaprenol N-acetylglucosamine transferase
VNAGPIMIMAGGTGGHVFPGLVVAQALLERQSGVVWLGTRRGLEARLVPQAGIEIEWISIAGLRGRGWAAWLAAPFRLLLALSQALAAVRRRRPSAVLGLGGFVSGPGGVAAWLSGRPLLIHEQNAVAGATNRWLARLAARVFEAFPGSFPRNVRAELIGNPVRPAISALPPPRERFAARANERARLLVLGGSQGARTLNRIVPEALAQLSEALRPSVWHQAGAGIADVRASYAAAGLAVRADAFIEDMAGAYAWADLVVARAGALTLAELGAAGIGAVLIPYPYAVDDHQTKNAEQFVADGAGVAIPERELDAAGLARELTRLLGDKALLIDLAERARRGAQTQAAERLASACLEAAKGAQ